MLLYAVSFLYPQVLSQENRNFEIILKFIGEHTHHSRKRRHQHN